MANKKQAPALEELIADLVHKLNGPLASIRGFSELILSKLVDPGIKKDVEMIVKEADRASHIVKNLVAFTKKRDQRKQPVDLNQIVEEVVREKADELKSRNLTLTKALDPSLPLTMADPQEIEQVFINLIENKDFDFVICDMRMPGMDGEGFYRTVEKRAASLQNKIIFSTGDVLGRKTKAFLNSIKNSRIEKPFNLKHLKEVIADLLNRPAH